MLKQNKFNSLFLAILPKSLFSRKEVFIVPVIVRAVIVRALKETVHLVLIEVHKTGVAVVILIIHIVYALIAISQVDSPL